MNGWGVFSTLRVDSGVLFCFDRHYARMRRDAARLKVRFPFSSESVHQMLLKLVDTNQAYDSTLRIAVIRNKGGLFEGPGIDIESDLIAFTTDLRDWGSGVRLGYQPNARFGQSIFAGTKYTSWGENLAFYESAHERGLDELVLLNELGQVSECTSANIFIIQGQNVWTPPLSTSGCLPGVTRALLLEEIQVPGLTISERELMPSELEKCEGAFLTSSTRDVLPVKEIDGLSIYACDERFHAVKSAFAAHRANYVKQHGHEPVGV